MQAFQLRYNQLFEGRGLSCTNCNTSMEGNGHDWLSFYKGRMVYGSKRCLCDSRRPLCVEYWVDNVDNIYNFVNTVIKITAMTNDCVRMKACAHCP